MIYPKFKDLKLDLLNYFNSDQSKYVYSKEKARHYFWISDPERYFDELDAHFEIIVQNNIVSVDLHFENTNGNQELFDIVSAHLPTNIVVKSWQGRAISHVKKFPLDSDIEIRDIIVALDELYDYCYPKIIELLKNRFPQKSSKYMEMQNIIELLLYKQQIILQGPPGTGKTRLAKEIAENIIGKKGINDIDIKKWIIVGSIIQSAKGTAQYKVKDISDRKVILERANETLGETSFDKIIECLNEEGWKNEIKDNDRRRTAAIAKFIHDKNDVTNNDHKLLQFHPSYTYEDFVRGIVAKSNGKEIEYKNVNKTLGLFAKDALANFNASTSASPEAMVEAWVDEKFELFKKDIEAKLPEEELVLSGDITIFQVSDSHFKYAEKWKTPGYLNYEEFKKLVKAILNGELDLANKQVDKEKFIHAHYRYTYYNALLKLFFDEYSFEKETPKVDAKNYVLVIDEINRANLSSVLGELIYALEYRGEEVESMYEVDGSQKLILPPNLYIVGTMNTADRSVGHIDYAIKRRFAFVDVLPKVLENNDEMIFNKELFEKVSRLFITNFEEYRLNSKAKLQRAKTLSPEFRPEDIWLGHSYFIQKKEKDENGNEILIPQKFSMRLEYEIKPILQEYVKDGVLIGSVTITEGGQESEIPVDQYIHSL